MTELKLRLLNDRVSRWSAFRLARERGWAELRYAEYVAVTQLQADFLVAGDAELGLRAEGLVRLAPLSALLG